MGVSHPPGHRVPRAGCPHAGRAGWLPSRTGIPRGSGDGLPRSPLWQRRWGSSHSWVPLGSPLKITTRNSVSKREELLSVTPRLMCSGAVPLAPSFIPPCNQCLGGRPHRRQGPCAPRERHRSTGLPLNKCYSTAADGECVC